MTHANDPLFQSFDLKGLKLSNRAVLAPMTRNRAHGAGDVQTDMNAVYYRQRASGGLLITEASQVSPEGKGYAMTPGIYSPQQIEGWKKVTRGVHERGGKIFLQLWHVGRISHPDFQPGGILPVAPSAIRPEGHAYTSKGKQDFVAPRELRADELPDIAQTFAKAAQNAIAAGFDGVEIHGANGYLID